jgi:hypothetical protein
MLIFERSPIEVTDSAPPSAAIPFLHFFSGYRGPDFYATYMRDLGFSDVAVRRIELDMAFQLVTGTRP